MMANKDGSRWKEIRDKSGSDSKPSDALKFSKEDSHGIHQSLEDMDLTSATNNHTQSVQTHCSGPLQQGNGFSFDMPTKFEKSIELLLDLNHRMKALSFSPSLNESLHDQHARNDVVSGDEEKGNLSSGKKEKVNYASLNTEKMEDAEVALTPPFYHQIGELKDALKDAVLKFNSF